MKRAATQAVAFEKHNLRLRRRQKGGGVRGASFYAAPARRLVVSRVRGGGGVDVRVLARALGGARDRHERTAGLPRERGRVRHGIGFSLSLAAFFFAISVEREFARVSPARIPRADSRRPQRLARGVERQVLPLPDAQLRLGAARGDQRREELPVPAPRERRDAVAAAAADGRLGEHAELLGHQDERSGPRGENQQFAVGVPAHGAQTLRDSADALGGHVPRQHSARRHQRVVVVVRVGRD